MRNKFAMFLLFFLIAGLLTLRVVATEKTYPTNVILRVPFGMQCDSDNRVTCAQLVDSGLHRYFGRPVRDREWLALLYFGELGLLHNTPYQETAIEALARLYYDEQAGMERCQYRSCIWQFLANSQHVIDSVVMLPNGRARVNIRRLLYDGSYLSYLSVADRIVDEPGAGWTTGMGYRVPSIWGNVAYTDAAYARLIETPGVRVVAPYWYGECAYIFLISTLAYRIQPTDFYTCGER